MVMTTAPSASASGSSLSESRESGTQAIVARQGIYDARDALFGYELLFRPASVSGVQLSDGDAATAQVLMSAFTDIGLAQLVAGHAAFINVPYAFLAAGYCDTLPTDNVVLEILEDVQVDAVFLERARDLARRGHVLSLDDFVYRPELDPLIELCKYIKLDVLALTQRQLEEHVDRLRAFDVTLVAEKVESLRQLERLRDLGVELFQGYALGRPSLVRGAATNANRAVLFELLTQLQDPRAEVAELAETIGRDPEIAYALLRILNSAHLSLANPINSLHQALIMLGADGLRNWATMMIMSRLAPNSHELTSGALIRAKMCELCARQTSDAAPAVAFTAGLLSCLPELVHKSMPNIARQLRLGPELTAALVNHRGPAGHILDCVLAYEHEDQERLATNAGPPHMLNTFLDAASWSTSVMNALTTTRE